MDSLKIGNITLPHRAVFGPMAGFTDAPCRRLMAQHGAGFTVSEMVSSRALVYHDHKTVSLLKAEPNGAPYGVQIFGEVPQIMGEAAAAIEEYEFDFLDINMGFVRMSSQVKNPMPPMIISSGIATETTGLSA